MREERDVHNFEKRLKVVSEKVRSSDQIDEDDKLAVLKFHEQCLAEGISSARIVKYIYILRSISKILKKKFKDANQSDIVRVVSKIEASKYSEWTKHDFKVALKKFYRWLKGISKKNAYPEEVDWITTTIKNSNSKLPEDILTEEEVKKLAHATDNIRDKSLVLVFYESGARVGELLNMRIKNVTFDDLGCVILLSGKTGDRRIRLVASAPALAEWINSHPDRDDGESYVWSIGYRAVNNIFKSLARKAKIKKRITPHIFRHSRATHLATKLTEQQLKQLMGWTMGSKMAQVYVHLSGRDLDNALLELHGLATQAKQEEKFKVKVCPRCNEKNSPDANYCKRCALTLDIETMEWENEMMDKLIQSKNAERYLKRILRAIAIKQGV